MNAYTKQNEPQIPFKKTKTLPVAPYKESSMTFCCRPWKMTAEERIRILMGQSGVLKPPQPQAFPE